jgi:hypothetical protein
MLLLHLLDQGDIFLLRVGRADALVDDLFPCSVFVFALYIRVLGGLLLLVLCAVWWEGEERRGRREYGIVGRGDGNKLP